MYELDILASGPNSIAASVISVRTGCWFPDSVTYKHKLRAIVKFTEEIN